MDLFQLPNCASFLAYTLSRSSPSVHPAVKTFSKACCGGDAGKHCDLSIECSAQHQRCLGGARHRLALVPLHRLALLPLHRLYLSEGLSKSSEQVEAYVASSQWASWSMRASSSVASIEFRVSRTLLHPTRGVQNAWVLSDEFSDPPFSRLPEVWSFVSSNSKWDDLRVESDVWE